MTDTITITGLVATAPRHLVTSEGLPITSFRLASSQRRFDRAKQRWVDGETNWYTVTAFRHLAINLVGSVDKGDRLIVTGRLRVRNWENGERSGTTVDIEADAVGPDLTWGTARFTRIVASSVADAAEPGEGGGWAATPDRPAQAGAAAGNSTDDDEADEDTDDDEAEDETVLAGAGAEKVRVPF